MKKIYNRVVEQYREYREIDKALAKTIQKPLIIIFMAGSIVTFIAIIKTAIDLRSSDTFTIFDRLSFVFLGISGFAGILLSYFGEKNNTKKGFLVLIIEFFLLGLLFQLFSLTS